MPHVRKNSFAPVVDENSRLLILGSLPGEQSLARGQYYGNPRNQFWRLAGEVIGLDLAGHSYDARLKALLAAGIGLWDVVESAVRPGSLDAAIRDHAENDINALAAGLPALRAIAFNGGKAAQLGRRLIGAGSRWALVDLPSSSPAFTLSYEEKRARWTALRAYL